MDFRELDESRQFIKIGLKSVESFMLGVGNVPILIQSFCFGCNRYPVLRRRSVPSSGVNV